MSLRNFIRQEIQQLKEDGDPCWKGYQQIGMKDKDGRQVPNCVPEQTYKNLTAIEEDSDKALANKAKESGENLGVRAISVYDGDTLQLGEGITTNQTFIVKLADGNGATGSATLAADKVTAVTVATGGNGYHSSEPPTVKFTGGGTPTRDALARAVVDNQQISKIYILM